MITELRTTAVHVSHHRDRVPTATGKRMKSVKQSNSLRRPTRRIKKVALRNKATKELMTIAVIRTTLMLVSDSRSLLQMLHMVEGIGTNRSMTSTSVICSKTNKKRASRKISSISM